MPYTMGQAAKATGISKPTLSRAIKAGTISAIRNANGSYTIDPAELHRVFPPASVNGSASFHVERSETPAEPPLNPTADLRARLADALDQVADLRRRADAVDQVADLRRRLDQEAQDRREAQAKLAALLTDQRQPARRRWWLSIFRR